MASLITRNRPQRPSTICEACLKHLTASRKPAPGPLRFFSAATRPTATRAFDDERRSPGSTPTRLRNYSSFPAASITAEPNLEIAADNDKKSTFLTRGPIQPGAPPPETQYARLINRRLIALSGPDAAKFLQGLVTNNVDPEKTIPFYAAFLDARGRMLHDVFIWTYPGLYHEKSMVGTKGMGEWACYIEVEASEVEALFKHLKRHKLRSKVDIRVVEGSNEQDVSEDPQVWAVWGGQKAIKKVSEHYKSLATLGDPRFIFDHTNMNTSVRMTVERVLLRPLEAHASTTISGDFTEYIKLRYRYGVIEGEEIPKETNPLNKGSALPMEYNVDISNGIDFKKGCYVGQELTIRTKHTGVVRKRILPVELSKSDASETASEYPKENFNLDPSQFESSDIKQLDENGKIKKGRAAGKLISVAGNLGLALCRLEMMTSMKVSAEGGSWKPGMKFGMEDCNGNIIKVKPFLRDKWVARVRDLWDKKRERI